VDIYEMSAETIEWLRSNIKVGFMDIRGPAWWAQGFRTKTGEWAGLPEGSHFAGPVPMDEVETLLAVPFVKGIIEAISYTDADGNPAVTDAPGTMPIIRATDGQVFSFPKKGYRIHPFLETLSGFIQAIQFNEAVQCGSVGLLKGGGVAFLQAVLPDFLEVEGYGYQPYIMGVTSVDTSKASQWVTGMKGAVCDNTVDGAIIGAATKIRKRHTGKAPTVAWARENLGLRIAQTGDEIGKAITELCKIDVSDADFALWLDEMQPAVKPDPRSSTGGPKFTNAEAKRTELTRLWASDAKVKPWAGTAFGVLQAANTYGTWSGKVTGTGGRIEQNLTRMIDGRTAKADMAAMDKLAVVLDRRRVMATA
jgi:phage/plasmid-like protein (TIGR03299 family)